MFRHKLVLTVNFMEVFAKVKRSPTNKFVTQSVQILTKLKLVGDLNLAFNSIFGFSVKLASPVK